MQQVSEGGSFHRSVDSIDKEHKTKLTHKKVTYIRNNLDKSTEELQKKTNLSKAIIKEIICVKKKGLNNEARSYSRKGRKFSKLTQEMKAWMLKKGQAKENGELEATWREITNSFNERYPGLEITPVSKRTFPKWCKGLVTGKLK